ncbi:MAG: class I SAM-dependent rRNA methyltransferase [Clostridiales bacterium]|nr:class I SAM-dependent rRNA methyltransferase [Clostridiales bacterium]
MKIDRPYIRANITPKAEKAVKRGHPWVYGEEIVSLSGAPENGDIVDVFAGNSWQGSGFYNSNSKITIRIFSRNSNDVFDYDFWKRRVVYAINYRRTVMPGPDFQSCRLIHGEADQMPGLTVDRYEDLLSVEIASLGMERLRPVIYKALTEVLGEIGVEIKGIYERNEIALRTKEGLELYKDWYEDIPHQDSPVTTITENGIKYLVDIKEGQKTGFFLDQKYNRAAAARIASGKTVLDCFTHTGSFGLNVASKGARHVTSVDISETAILQARKNAELNGLDDKITYECADVFEYLTRLAQEKRRDYDYIILDPPAFTKSRDTVDSAGKGYKEINLKAMKLLPRGGYLATCSCSHFMTDPLFEKMLSSAAYDAGRSLRQIEKRTQAPDHPILWNVPETYYLKFYIFQVF